MNQEGRVNIIPNYIAASSPKELRRLMFLVNIANSTQHKFFDIQFVKGKWFAWYYAPVDEALEIEELTK